LGDERGQPADFQLKSDDDEQVGALEFEEETGLGIDEVRILIATSDGFALDFIAADFLGQGGEVAGGGHDLDFSGGGARGRWTDQS